MRNKHDHNEKILAELEKTLLESCLEDYSCVDPYDAYRDSDGTHWSTLRVTGFSNSQGSGCFDEARLEEIRRQSRDLVLRNEFAINALENRVNYIVGLGHKYYAIPHDDRDLELAESVREVLREFCEENQWDKRHREIVRRNDRDGEVFLRFFPDPFAPLRVRFVEPEQVSTPSQYRTYTDHRFGIHSAKSDVETVYGYWIDGEYVAAEEVQHRKANVDGNSKRGLPLFYPVQKNFRRIEKLQRNMSVVAEIQSAIALVRKHAGGTAESLRQYVRQQSQVPSPDSGGSFQSMQQFAPGTIIDVQQGTDFQFPITAIDASRYILILQAELRAIASRLVIPEFMLSSDASNANYSSTMVAEGPAVRMFERLQYEMISEDLRVMRRAVQHAIHRGVLPHDTFAHIVLHAIPPMLAVRDRLKEAKADEILLNCGVLSMRTMAMRYGLDPENETKLRTHCDRQCDCCKNIVP